MAKQDYLMFKPAAGDLVKLRALAAAQGLSVSEVVRWCVSHGLRYYARRPKVVVPQVAQAPQEQSATGSALEAAAG